MPILLRAEDVHKGYRMGGSHLQVLRGASVNVEAGETVAIIGRSGAGKSTLLHILGGLDAPDDGTITFRGESLYERLHTDPGHRPALRGLKDVFSGRRIRESRFRNMARARHIGFVFQAYHLLPELTVIENTILPAMARMVHARSGTEMRRRGMELLELAGIANRATHKPMELSGGEQQRLALARSLMNDPQLILADEPTGNLDDKTGQQVLDVLFDLSRTRNMTVILVTHNDKVARQCSRTLVLSDGKLT